MPDRIRIINSDELTGVDFTSSKPAKFITAGPHRRKIITYDKSVLIYLLIAW